MKRFGISALGVWLLLPGGCSGTDASTRPDVDLEVGRQLAAQWRSEIIELPSE